MPRYSDQRKEAVLRKMLPPHNRPLAELAAAEGISEATLYKWRREARDQGRLLPDGAGGPAGWSTADKFAAVVETAAKGDWAKCEGSGRPLRSPLRYPRFLARAALGGASP